MGIYKYLDERSRRYGFIDTKLTQAAMICAALFFVKFFPWILSLDAWWYALLAVLFAIKPVIFTFLAREKAHDNT